RRIYAAIVVAKSSRRCDAGKIRGTRGRSTMIGALFDRLNGRHADEFTRMAADFRKRCRRWPLEAPANTKGPRVGVVITPWMRTAVAFFSLECARELARQGARPVLLWDEANVFFNTADRGEVQVLRDLL